MAGSRVRQTHGSETREVILAAAEKLFAEHGVAAVSNRQVSEAAGQANNFAVGYHFGTKNDLVLAIVRRHAPPIERRREEMLAKFKGSLELRDGLACLVLPITEHLASLGPASWHARFLAQVTTDPALWKLVHDETVASPSMRETTKVFERLLPILPAEVREERADMSRQIIVHMCAERERALHAGTPTPRASWEAAGVGLVDALAGLWMAPFTPAK
ncbi:TetR/AcrR family transcriptional regulator [Polyangium jinanense]|uniref:Helix-turn-helix transcriptional regulator n=1 Tax=Polyangium jinanense TaxID=2829994 RepID=A0A9X3XHN7_9BACT|nr:helix-turn-helix domain-containing protein [Polyangium jinanense]MDC3961775.1 helix-turn-helix transcriptional regulator [Polyangium jinanense]MDC3988331.1 helix-turn-helix transcriptional regulator [Polyangium jinanense]